MQIEGSSPYLSSHGKRVSPAQLAAMLVEKSVYELRDSQAEDESLKAFLS